MIYRLERIDGALRMHYHGHASVAPGMGPRHMVFAPSGKQLYLICEMGSCVYAYNFDPQTGELHEAQHLSTLPEDFTGENNCADLHLSPDGRILYGSNRGHDSMVIYHVCPESGRLTLAGWQSSEGKTPRNFTLTPDGRWLLAANQDSDGVTVFAIDGQSGLLSPRTHLQILAPVWLGLLPSGMQ